MSRATEANRSPVDFPRTLESAAFLIWLSMPARWLPSLL
jgi:hypothetical protein